MANPYTSNAPATYPPADGRGAYGVDAGGYALPSVPGADQQPQWGASAQPLPGGGYAGAYTGQPQYVGGEGAPNAYGVGGAPPAGYGQPPWVDPNARPMPSATPELKTWKCWSGEFYEQFFDVDTNDVLKRMGNVLLPFVPPDFLHERHWHMGNLPGGVVPESLRGAAMAFTSGEEKRADLYGPLWISTTLWVTLAIVGNIMDKISYTRRSAARDVEIQAFIARYGTHSPTGTRAPGEWSLDPMPRWTYNFEVATIAAALVYTYIIFMSFLVWGLMKWKSVPVGLTDALCLYGYSFFVFILTAILCAVPITAFQWLVCILAAVWTSAYLLLNFWQLWRVSLERGWFIGLVLMIIGTQLALCLGFKLYFFNYTTA
jgi:hypothetical protein